MVVLIVVVLLIGLTFALIFNQIVREDNIAKSAFSTVEVLLKKRYDLIPNLVEVVKGSAAHEKEVFEMVAQKRTEALESKTPDETVKCDGALNASLKSLLMVAENYPDLKANESYITLQKNLAELEDEIAAARRTYNSAVTEYNTTLDSFPSNIVGYIIGKKHKELFSTTDEVRKAISVNI